MKIEEMNCGDCGAAACKVGSGYPEFCMTTKMNPETLKEALAAYDDPETRRFMQTAATVEYDGYLKWCRVQETVEFARRMGYHKLGIATCTGLLAETRILTEILRSCGFEVVAIGCKAGSIPKTQVGIDEKCCEIGPSMCNPILQAKILNEAKTELNIVMGLCVGHDSLFYKNSEAPVTTLVAKDRVTGNNPVAALYTAKSYYRRLKDL